MAIDRNTARNIVNAVFDELGGRGGVGDQLDMVHDDPGIYAEMHNECVERVVKAYASLGSPTSSRWDPEAS